MSPSENTNEEPLVVVAAGETTDGNSDDEIFSGNSSPDTTSVHIPSREGYTCGGVTETLRTLLVLMASPLTDEKGSTKSVVAGLATIAVVGTCIGLGAPTNKVLTPSYRRISAALGYIYFMAWSVSFYPQVISNFKRKSTVGLSPDFCVLNVIGFNCYTAYNAALYWNPSIQKLYKERYGPDAEITVQSNDVAFAIHALVLSIITLCQIMYYNNTTSGNNETAVVRLSKPILVVIIGIAIICIGFPLMIVLDKKDGEQHNNNYYLDNNEYDESSSSMGSKYNWLDFIYVLSYIKIFISLIKYIPQVLLNFRRKSTMGWSIWNILLDLTGGTLSDLQLVLDCANLKDFSGITHNKAKLALGSLSIVFDLVFLVQHYCLYSGTTTTTTIETNEQSEPLLPPTVGDTEEGMERDESSSSLTSRTIFV